MTATRNERRSLQGIVKSTKCAQTITVEVHRTTRHPKYGKFVRHHKKYHAHDEKQEAQPGDTVEIQATRPLSKTKRWRLVRIVERNRLVELSTVEGEAVNRTTEETSGKQAPSSGPANAEGGDA